MIHEVHISAVRNVGQDGSFEVFLVPAFPPIEMKGNGTGRQFGVGKEGSREPAPGAQELVPSWRAMLAIETVGAKRRRLTVNDPKRVTAYIATRHRADPPHPARLTPHATTATDSRPA